MPSQIESGISTYVGHFRLLIDVVGGFGSRYNPTRPELTVASLVTQLGKVRTSIETVDTLLPSYALAEGLRHDEFVKIPPLAVRVQAIAVSSDLPKSILTRIKEVVRKIEGRRATQVTPPPNDGSGDERRHISVSQVSFNEQIEHFQQLISLVASQPTYNPSETALQVASLESQLTLLNETNDTAMVAIVPLTAAREARNELLYAPHTGMMDTALAVKEYVKGAFGANSAEYKKVRRISFKNRKAPMATE
jgi:hypothetical protein